MLVSNRFGHFVLLFVEYTLTNTHLLIHVHACTCTTHFIAACLLTHIHVCYFLQATQSLETGDKPLLEDNDGPKPEADKGVVRRSSSGGFIVNKPDPSTLPISQHIRHNYRGGPREQLYQRQPTLPSLPEHEDIAGTTEEEGAVSKENTDQQQLTTL